MPSVSASRARWQTAAAVAGSALLAWRHPGAGPFTLAAVALGFAVLAWLVPARYAPIQRQLDRLLHGFLTVLTWVMLGVIYFGLFTPLRVAGRILRRDPLGLRRAPVGDSYLTPPPGAAGRFDRQF